MYTTMRADPCLCFVERCGRPNEQDINAEQQAVDPELGEGSVSNRANLYTYIIVLQLIWLTGIFKLIVLFIYCLRGDYDKYSEDPEFKPATRHTKEVYEEVCAF